MIKTQEEKIKKLLKANSQAQQALRKMLEFYEILDKINMSTHSKLIKNIYVYTKKYFTWELANIANVSQETCARYRKKYIKCFYLCLEQS